MSVGNYAAASIEDGCVMLTKRSMITKQLNTLPLPMTMEEFESRVARYMKGELLQEAFDNLDAPLREFVKTGVTPDEWKLLGSDDE